MNSLVLVSLLFWGVWGIFDKKALAFTQPAGQLVVVYLLSPLFVVVTAALMTIYLPGWQLTGHTMYWEFLASFASVVATAAYLVAMSRGEASLILGATASYPVVAQVLAYLMLGEQLVPIRVIGCLVVVAGVIALTTSSMRKNLESPSGNDLSSAPVRGGSGIWTDSLPRQTTGAPFAAVQPAASTALQSAAFAGVQPAASSALQSAASTALLERNATTEGPATIEDAAPHTDMEPVLQPVARHGKMNTVIVVSCVALSVLGWALRGIFDKHAVDAAHPFEVYVGKYIADTVFGFIALAWLLCKSPAVATTLKHRQLWPFSVGSAICLAGGSAAYYVVLSMTSASYVIAITGCYPLVMYVLALLVLKEKFNAKRAIGIALITFGGILTQLTQNS